MEQGLRAGARLNRALVVEDEESLRRSLCGALEAWGFAVTPAAAGGAALLAWRESRPDIVLLDLGLPDLDGLDVLQHARRMGLRTPVIVLTARAMIGDRVLGLNLGADAYLTKPFDLDELGARVRAILRCNAGAVAPPAPAPPLHLGRLTWAPGGKVFYCADDPLPLSDREAALLRVLVERPNRACARQFLLETVFAGMAVRDDALEVVAFRLRRKLMPCGVCLVTLRGLGYLLKADGHSATDG